MFKSDRSKARITEWLAIDGNRNGNADQKALAQLPRKPADMIMWPGCAEQGRKADNWTGPGGGRRE